MAEELDRPHLESVVAAWDLAGGLLSEVLPRRWRHSQGVWRRAVMVGDVLVGGDDELLEQAAILHDVGYAPQLALTGFHPVDGARYLRSIGLDERIVSLVAHHSCAQVEAEQRNLGAELAEFSPGPPVLTDFLLFCDMTTSPDGLQVTLDERLSEILDRHGTRSIVARSMLLAEPQLRAATRRVAERLAGGANRHTA